MLVRQRVPKLNAQPLLPSSLVVIPSNGNACSQMPGYLPYAFLFWDPFPPPDESELGKSHVMIP